jgi:hypothetical protein
MSCITLSVDAVTLSVGIVTMSEVEVRAHNAFQLLLGGLRLRSD